MIMKTNLQRQKVLETVKNLTVNIEDEIKECKQALLQHKKSLLPKIYKAQSLRISKTNLLDSSASANKQLVKDQSIVKLADCKDDLDEILNTSDLLSNCEHRIISSFDLRAKSVLDNQLPKLVNKTRVSPAAKVTFKTQGSSIESFMDDKIS